MRFVFETLGVRRLEARARVENGAPTVRFARPARCEGVLRHA
jgi:hypothetical protein